MSTSTSRPSAILWLIGFIGDRGVVTRKECIDAAAETRNRGFDLDTVSKYLSTQNHYGHTFDPKPGWRKRKAYFSRIKRGTYTLTTTGWIRYFYEVCGECP